MRALVIYESMFGNTKAVAEAIAEGLRAPAGNRVEAVEVGEASSAVESDIDLVVVGAPTHALSLSRPNTRQDAATKTSAPLVSRGQGIREWLAELPRGGTWQFTTFDTRIATPRIPGSAARAAERRLRRAGHRPVTRPESFWVAGINGPLVTGELHRANEWGQWLARHISAEGAREVQS